MNRFTTVRDCCDTIQITSESIHAEKKHILTYTRIALKGYIVARGALTKLWKAKRNQAI